MKGTEVIMGKWKKGDRDTEYQQLIDQQTVVISCKISCIHLNNLNETTTCHVITFVVNRMHQGKILKAIQVSYSAS